MKEENAEDLLQYLSELWLATPALTKDVLDSKDLTKLEVHGQLFPTDDDRIRFNYRIDKPDEGTFDVPSYTISLLETPPIQHVINDFADTEKLELQLKAINWAQSYSNIVQQKLDVEDLVAEVLTMKLLNRSLSDVADQLMVKYWQGTPMEDQLFMNIIPKGPEPKELTLPITGDYTDIDIIESYNLMKGRAVMKSELKEGESALTPNAHWLILEDSHLVKLPGYDIDAQVRQLSFKDPLTADTFADMMTWLYKGEQVATQLLTSDKLIDGYLQADPKNASLIFWDKEHQQIPLQEITEDPKQKIAAAKREKAKVTPKGKRKGHRL